MDETGRVLALLNSTFPDVAHLPPLEARAAVDARVREAANLHDVAEVVDVVIAAGAAVPVRVYRPHDADLIAHAPTTVFAHGGGFLHGSIASHDGFCRRWAKHTGAPVLSVGYRLAPEHPAPAALEDVLTAVDWAVAQRFAGDGVVLAGDSSGGNLAAAAALALRDRGDSPVIGQVLLYPFLDPQMRSESYRTRGAGFFVTAGILAAYWRAYLGAADASEYPALAALAAADPRIAPLAGDLRGAPPAVIVTGGLDPLCDEGRDCAARLRDAGVPVIHRRYPDQFHGFATIPGYGPADSAQEILWADMRRYFAPRSTTLTEKNR